MAEARRALQSNRSDAEACNLMAFLSQSDKKGQQAVYYAGLAAAAQPLSAVYQANLGKHLGLVGESARAVKHLLRASELAPGDASIHRDLAHALFTVKSYTDAAEHAGHAVRIEPDNRANAEANALALIHLGRASEAVDSMRDHVARHPGDARSLSLLAFTMNYAPGVSPEEIFIVHRAFGEALRRAADPGRQRDSPTSARSAGMSDLAPTVAFLSPDLKSHSVAYFLEPLLRATTPADARVVLYATAPGEDATTVRLRGLAQRFTDVSALGAEALAERIRADKVDIAIDLAGHTNPVALYALAFRPARLTGTFLGYPNTSGLNSVNVRLVDSTTDPPGAEAYSVEQLLRLDPCFIVYQPPSDAPDPAEAPSLRHGSVTFGSFNSNQKFNRPLLDLWAGVLRAVPQSRLLLKNAGLSDAGLRERIQTHFRSNEIAPDRVELLGWIDAPGGHLGAYAHIDIALDTFPYHGTTTTCEALYMGVPLISRIGSVHASRVGLSLLKAIGVSELAAETDEDYIRLARELAADEPRRIDWRTTLRPRMTRSPLMDYGGYARRFWATLLAAWRSRGDADDGSHRE